MIRSSDTSSILAQTQDANLEPPQFPPNTDPTLTSPPDPTSGKGKPKSGSGKKAKKKVEQILDQFVDSTEDKKSREEMENMLDGKQPDVRSDEEQKAVTDTVKDTRKTLKKKTEVVVVNDSGKAIIRTDSGEKKKVQLSDGEDSKVVKMDDGTVVVVLDNDLSKKETKEAAADAVEELIIDAAEDNNLQLAARFFKSFKIELYEYFIEIDMLKVYWPLSVENSVKFTNDDPLVEEMLRQLNQRRNELDPTE